MKKVVRIFCIFWLLTILGKPDFTRAGDEPNIRVDAITPGLTGGNLAVSAVFENVFSKKIVGTIQSGLPSVIKIDIQILNAGKKSIFEKQIGRSIQYNIWEERYSIRNQDTTVICKKFEQVLQHCTKLEHEFLLPKTALDQSRPYRIRIRIEIIPISSTQGKKVSEWLLDSNQTEEDLASEDRSSGFKLNLSKLVTLFVGGEKSSKYRSEWSLSEPFLLKTLQPK